jgi:hypothetical protein
MSQERIKKVPIKNLVSEEGAHELARSPNMEPYIRLAMAALQQFDLTPNVEEIAELPLEKRYVWRVASALKWGFADFDSVNVAVDKETLSLEDLENVMELVKYRHIQFAMFLKTLVGTEEMERRMNEGIAMMAIFPVLTPLPPLPAAWGL